MGNLSSPPSSWYNPPEYHEVCKCEDCHEVGEHEEDIEYWADHGCNICWDLVQLNNFH